MNVFLSILLVVQVLSALGVIVLVLLQHGKGADMGASFGSGASGSLFGATGSANFLSRTTGGLAAVFFASTLALGFVGNQRGPATGGSSVLDRVAPAKTDATNSDIPKADGAKSDGVQPQDAGKSDIPAGVTTPAATDAVAKPSTSSEVPK